MLYTWLTIRTVTCAAPAPEEPRFTRAETRWCSQIKTRCLAAASTPRMLVEGRGRCARTHACAHSLTRLTKHRMPPLFQTAQHSSRAEVRHLPGPFPSTTSTLPPCGPAGRPGRAVTQVQIISELRGGVWVFAHPQIRVGFQGEMWTLWSEG